MLVTEIRRPETSFHIVKRRYFEGGELVIVLTVLQEDDSLAHTIRRHRLLGPNDPFPTRPDHTFSMLTPQRGGTNLTNTPGKEGAGEGAKLGAAGEASPPSWSILGPTSGVSSRVMNCLVPRTMGKLYEVFL
jgi:hypothetical protein